MPINLTVKYPLSNGDKLVFNEIRIDEDAQTFNYTVSMRTAAGGNPPDSRIASRRLQIRATDGDVVSRNAAPTAGGNQEDVLSFNVAGPVSRATAFADALAAYRTSKNAFEAHALAVGYIHATLTGT